MYLILTETNKRWVNKGIMYNSFTCIEQISLYNNLQNTTTIHCVRCCWWSEVERRGTILLSVAACDSFSCSCTVELICGEELV